MAFEQETGTGSATSNSYASIAQFRSYWTDRGTDYIASTDATIEAWLILATEYIDASYRFLGSSVNVDQALDWPRVGMMNDKGKFIDSDTIPNELINATCWLASQSKNNLNPVDTGLNEVSYGPVRKKYSKSTAQKSFPIVAKLLESFLLTGNKLQRVN